MTTYTIIPNGDGTGFNIGIAGNDGARQTMLGFTSEAEAEAWIDQDKRLSNGTASYQPPATLLDSGSPSA
ncbi:MAG TPA: hypothetical protein VGF36_14885 [Rhodopila sp.]